MSGISEKNMTLKLDSNITIAQSHHADGDEALKAIHSQLTMHASSLILFFCSSHYDLKTLENGFNRYFEGQCVIGCTTAGEIGPLGYTTHSIVAFSLPSASFEVAVASFDDVKSMTPDLCLHRVQDLFSSLNIKQTDSHEGMFALHLVDGLSHAEELSAHLFQRALGDVPMVGGSAGDDLRFRKTQIFYDGQFHEHAALVALIKSQYSVHIFKEQQFVPGSPPLVVTEADPDKRTVYTLNGFPASAEYARMVGRSIDDLSNVELAEHPVMVRVDGVDYVRSIQSINADGSLTFYCAIERGLVLRVAKDSDLVSNLKATMHALIEKSGPPQLMIGFDCVFRRIAIEAKQQNKSVEAILSPLHMVGFSTYGEQFMGVHVNQSLTGVMIGAANHD